MEKSGNTASQTDNAFEECVCCRENIPVSRNTDICERQYYIEGAGQLCRSCYLEIYGRKY